MFDAAHPLVVQHGKPEVAQLQAPAAVCVHVGRLDVEVQDPGAVQRGQAAGHVAEHLRHRRRAQTLPRRRLHTVPGLTFSLCSATSWWVGS